MPQAKTPRVRFLDVDAPYRLSRASIGQQPDGHGGARGNPQNAVRDLGRLRRDSRRRAHGNAGFGLSAPENVSIIGVDDHQMSWFLGLTTIAQTAANPGAFAASVLMQRLHPSGLPNPPLASPPSKHLLDTKLVGRTGTRRR